MGAPFILQEESVKDVELIDWNIHKKGFSDVVKAYEDIFTSVNTFEITSPGIGDVSSTDSVLLYPVIKVDTQAFLCRIDIAIDGKEPLKVIDIITLNNEGLISKINAFKQ